jgi:TonB family protein
MEQLVPINQTPPRWPRNARGIVDAQFTVTEQGEVTDIVVLDNPGRNLERAITRAMRQWRFEPVLFNGRPLPVRSSVRYTLQP